MKATGLTYLKPHEAGLNSEARAVGRKVGALLDALDGLDHYCAAGELVEEVREFKLRVLNELRAEGWRIKVNGHDRWQVLPPTDY